VGGSLIPDRWPGTLGREKAREPRLVGPAHRFGGGSTDERNGMRVYSVGNTAGNRSGGESSEGRIPRALPV